MKACVGTSPEGVVWKGPYGLTITALKTTLLLVRHGETEYNRREIVQGRRIDSVLNETGQQQAEHLARRLADIRFDAIYASPLRRAVQTASAVAQRHPDVPLHTLADLEEMSWGIYEGREATEEVRTALDRHFEAWKQGQFGVPIQEGESILQVQMRALRALDHILATHEGETVLIVTHGRWLRVLLASILPGYELRRMHEIKHANTGVNLITFEGKSCRAALLNCTAHLEADMSVMVE